MLSPEILSAGVGSAAGGLTVGTIAWFFFRNAVDRFVRRADSMEADLISLRDRDLQEVKARVAHIEQNCRAETNAQAIDSYRPVLSRIEAKLDSTAKDLASIEGKMASWEGWISDVRKEEREIGARLIQHMTDARSHGGRDDAR